MTNQERIEEFKRKIVDLCVDDLSLDAVRLYCATSAARHDRNDESLHDQTARLFIFGGDYRQFSRMTPEECAHCLDYEEFGARNSDPGDPWNMLDYDDDEELTKELTDRLDEMLAEAVAAVDQARAGELTIPSNQGDHT